ncbi:hypothetical protein ACWD4F_33030 [Streptomyces aureus]|uniref:hypothetical protein n=1 Tax=Streptomyces aureus TaxID=193461 RepID=UPI00056B5AA6|nr:hypothetical protein [Streptomyces aureus]
MGVFERLLRRSKAVEEAPVAAQPVVTDEQVTVDAEDSSGSGDEVTEDTAGAVTAATEDVEIPRQQTADQAPDNEAGKGSRT